MKKIYLFVVLIFLCIGKVEATSIESINTTVDIDQNGHGHVTEVWQIDADTGTESYHSFGKMTDRSIKDFSVSRDDVNYTYIDNWNIDASKTEKENKNGINYTSDGLELCWGIEYGNHSYKVNYTIENLVWQYDDAQIMYFAFLPKNMKQAPKEFNLTINPNNNIKDVKYSSYGFKSNNSIKDNKIYFKSYEKLNSNNYVVALVGFPNNTFTNLNVKKEGTYDNITDESLKGATLNKKNDIWEIIGILFWPALIVIIAIISFFVSIKNRPIIDKSEYNIPKKVNNFRDVPFNKDFLLAYYIAREENIFDKKNLIGAYLLKWINEKRIEMVPTEGGIIDFNKNDNYYIDITNIGSSTITPEQSLIDILKKASKEGKVTPKDFKRYCKNHYNSINSWLDSLKSFSKNKLISEGYILESEKNKRKVYKYTNKLQEQVIYLKGLKQFLEDMSLIDEKKAIEVHLWNEYLIFASAMGIADKVAKQFKNFYPDLYQNNNMYTSTMWASSFSTVSVSAAMSAKAAASSGGSFSGGGYSSGGFSSGGGGVR